MREVTEIELAAASSFTRRILPSLGFGDVINKSYIESKLGVSCGTRLLHVTSSLARSESARLLPVAKPASRFTAGGLTAVSGKLSITAAATTNQKKCLTTLWLQ